MDKHDFRGKTIVVTGAGQGKTNSKYLLITSQSAQFRVKISFEGIGRDVCERLTELGATVYAISRSLKPLQELKKSHPNVFILQMDLSDWSKTRTELANVIKDIKIDGLVNNAGVGASKSVFDLTEEDFDRLVYCSLSHYNLLLCEKFNF